MPVAQKMMLQLAERDIRHLTDEEPPLHRPHEWQRDAPAGKPAGRLVSCVRPFDLGERVTHAL